MHSPDFRLFQNIWDITYHIPVVHIYSDNAEELSTGLIRGRGDVIVHVLRPDSELIFTNIQQVNGLTIVEPIQVVIDLFCLGGACRDAAMKLYQSLTEQNGKELKEAWNDENNRNKGSTSSRRKLLPTTA